MRAFLTIFGITIGVFALVVMGSMAEKINLLIEGGTRYYSDKVVITDASTPTGGFSTTPIAVSRIQEIEDHDFRPGFRQSFTHGATKNPAATGDDGDLVLKTKKAFHIFLFHSFLLLNFLAGKG